MRFFNGGLRKLAFSALTKDSPIYVQFYVTARCNLACEQCNIIYANADQQEASLEQCSRIAENLNAIGVSVVLLTGGEPFVRRDLPQIAAAMVAHRIHPRIQTNGLARLSQLEEMVAVGVRDISISLDSLLPDTQDAINGQFPGSWNRAMKTISNVSQIFPKDSFAALGCVLAPRNLDHVPAVIEFASSIGWWVSLVPAHTTDLNSPRGFSTYDTQLNFMPQEYSRVRDILDLAREMRNSGANLYDSDEYLDDIYRFITHQPVQWRRRNHGVCDSPNLYFAIQPNGDMAVCCDFRLPHSVPVHDPHFPEWYRNRALRAQVKDIASSCPGCMYGSFPEISVSARFFRPMWRRTKLFLMSDPKRRLRTVSEAELNRLAAEISDKYNLRPRSGAEAPVTLPG